MRKSHSTSHATADRRRTHGRRPSAARRGSPRLRRATAFLCRNGFRAVSVTLIISLLAVTAPAAPVVLKDVYSEVSLGVTLWGASSGWADAVRNLAAGQQKPSPKKQEKQSEREARVARIEVSPDNGTALAGEPVRFAAVAYDQKGEPVSGVRFKWRAAEVGGKRHAHISRGGVFESRNDGTFEIVAEANGLEGRATLKVNKTNRGKEGEQPSGKGNVSTRDLPPGETSQRKAKPAPKAARRAGAPAFVKASYAAAAPAPAPAPAASYYIANEWNQDNYMYADDPGNERGDPPGTAQDDGAGSGNFQMATPVLSLPGRGLDISLVLAYNSRLWTKSGSEITYDMDKDWPAPGWSLGFGKIIGMNTGGSMMVDADGTRHSFTGQVTTYSWGATYFNGQTTDGTFVDFWTYSYQGAANYGWAKLSNGTVIDYGAPGGGAIYPTQITDANGNVISITYVNNQGPRIHTVTDTLGRSVNFHYDASSLLTAVTAPGLGGGTRTAVRLHYRQHTVQPGFAYWLTPRVRNYYPMVIDAVYYPGSNTGYWFGDGDSYSAYGMIAKPSERRGMGLSAGSLNEQGTVTSAGSVTEEAFYNYPMAPDYNLTDAPTYTTRTHSWSGMDTAPAVTTYAVFQGATPRRVEVTHPNGTKNIQYSFNAPGQWHDGLVYQDETRDAANTLLQSSYVHWQQGAYNSPRPWRMEATDERGQMTATELSYGAVYNQVTEVRNYDYGGAALLRVTRKEYENGASYTGRHIFNLVKSESLFDGDGVTRVSRTEYEYDGGMLADAPGAWMHQESHNPYAEWYEEPCDCWYEYNEWGYAEYVCHSTCWRTNYDPGTNFRGNVTKVTKYANAATLDPSTASVETRAYNKVGNMISASTSCCAQTTYNYTVDTQYAYPTAETRGSATDATARTTTSGTFDFNTGLPLSSTDENGRTTLLTYFADTLRSQEEIQPTGARIVYSYADAEHKITETTYTGPGGAVADQSVKHLNGLGKVRREEALGAGGAWDVIETKYTNMGLLWKQSRPYRSGQQSPLFGENVYDALGRETTERAADGSETRTFYNEPSRPSEATAAAGQTTRVVDGWGRERWGRQDAFGQLVEVVEPDANGGGSVASNGARTTYAYNTLGKLALVTQGSQQRRFRYDGLGRLTHQKLAEAAATLNDAGQYVGAGGQWSNVFGYDTRSNLVARVDARGVTTSLNYNGDPLNRLQSISYSIGGAYDSSSPIASAAAVTYGYMTGGDVKRLRVATAAGVSTEEYGYDAEGRLSQLRLTLSSRPSHPLVTDYGHDTLNRLTSVTYPTQYPTGTRKTVTHAYDAASRLSGLQVNGVDYASEIAYDAASQNTSVKVGGGTGVWKRESYEYDAATGLMSRQTVLRDNITPVLDLSYDYLRPGTGSGRTGQMTKIINNLDRAKDRGFEYDTVGRLKRATGGLNVNWVQRYNYDRYGNRTNAYSFAGDAYVRNFYLSALGRQPSAGELQTWLGQLQSAYAQGPSQFLAAMQSLGNSLFSSQEYANRGRSDRDYVYDLYKAYLFREPDQGGWDFWTSIVPSNGRAAVRDGFAYSSEFNMKVSGTSPYPPAAAVPRDGWDALGYDQASNRINWPGWEYDAAGNQTRAQAAAGGWQRLEYDAANRLVRVTDDSRTVVYGQYTYGDNNTRLVSAEGSTRTYYATAASGTIAEFTEVGGATAPQWSKNYIYLGGRLLATQQPGGSGETVQYHHPDRRGTRLVTNAADAGAYEQEALPFGVILNASAATSRRFTSYDRSPATGMDYAVNRHYDAQQGRFTQVDPLGAKASELGDPQSLNLYAYCANDPVNRLDPEGLFWGFLKKLFRIIKLIVKAVIVALVVVGMVMGIIPVVTGIKIIIRVVFGIDFSSWKSLLISVIREAFKVTVRSSIAQAVREGGFTIGSILRGLGRGIIRFFKGFIWKGFIPILYYGNFCGPSNPNQHTGNPPIDELDAACQEHDRVYQSSTDNEARLHADRRLFKAALWAIITGRLRPAGRFFGFFVAIGFGISTLFRMFTRSEDAAQMQVRVQSVNVVVGDRLRLGFS